MAAHVSDLISIKEIKHHGNKTSRKTVPFHRGVKVVLKWDKSDPVSNKLKTYLKKSQICPIWG